MKKKIVSVFLVVGMAVGLLTGCGVGKGAADGSETGGAAAGDEGTEALPEMMAVNSLTEQVLDDNYRSCYEIFVYSFYDSDGDGIGDLKGVTSKLDYINDGDPETDEDLGMNEIWLMPVMPSTTYHKYDVTDYEDIDPEYGTLEDFDELIQECHDRGIHVIIDFVMNHTSSQHPWFQEACEYLKQLPEGQEPDAAECPYVEYYNFSTDLKANYSQVGTSGWYYESKFWSEMPDLNLKNEVVRAEFADIVQFWLDRGVDGFRLDATGEYYSSSDSANVEVLSWFTAMVKEKKSDAYLVGEAWKKYPDYSKYYESGIDSMFDFAFADGDGYIAKVLNGTAKSKASTFGLAVEAVNDEIGKYTASYIDAPFYTNHDMNRGANYYTGEDAEAKVKMGQAMNLLMSGTTFLYYGEELGMKGAGIDENKRLGMLWSADENAQGMCDGPAAAEETEMTYGSLEEQMTDPYSIYNFVKQTMKIRNAYPEIARGTTTFLQEMSDEQVCVLQKEYEGSQLMLIYNVSDQEVTLDVSEVTLNGKKSADLETAGILQTGEDAPEFRDGTVRLPKYSVMILK